jgi:hypothetical protein
MGGVPGADTSPLRRTFPLAGGPRVRLRLARRSDSERVRALLAGRGVDASELEVLQLLTYDPARRFVLCAFAPLDGAETLVGIGAIELAPGADPDTLVVDEDLTDGLPAVLGGVLIERARAHARRAA